MEPSISPHWLAGFFDGEGCVNITVAGKHRRCILRLYLVNTNHELLRMIQGEYGGQLSVRHHPKNPHWKPAACITWTNKQAAALLEKIGDLLILKRSQMELAQQFLALRDVPNRYESSSRVGLPRGSHTYIYRVRPEVLAVEVGIKGKMHVLNRKGRAA